MQKKTNEIESESQTAVCNLHECIKSYAKLNESEVFYTKRERAKKLNGMKKSYVVIVDC